MLKINNHKKAEFGTLIAAIIVILGVFIISFIAYKFYLATNEKLEVQNCKNSIASHAFLADFSRQEIFTDIKCPVKQITLDAKNENNVKSVIAEDMHKCWYEWGQGKGTYFKGDGVFCHVCSIYTFKQTDRKITGMMQYLAEKDIKIKYPGDTPGLSYQDYLNGYTSPTSAGLLKNIDIQELAKQEVMDTSKKYATIFVYASGKTNIEKVLESHRTEVGTGGGLVLMLGVGAGVTGGLAAIGVVNVWNPVGWVSLAAALAVGGGAAIYNAVFVHNEPEWISFLALRNYTSNTLSDLGCQIADVNQQSNSQP